MIPANDKSILISSALADFGDLPLGAIAELDAAVLNEAIRRVLPEAPAVPVAAFNSAI